MKVLRRVLVLAVILAIIIVPLSYFDFDAINKGHWSMLLLLVYSISLPFLFQAFLVLSGLKKAELTNNEEFKLVSTIKANRDALKEIGKENKVVIAGIPEDVLPTKPTVEQELKYIIAYPDNKSDKFDTKAIMAEIKRILADRNIEVELEQKKADQNIEVESKQKK